MRRAVTLMMVISMLTLAGPASACEGCAPEMQVIEDGVAMLPVDVDPPVIGGGSPPAETADPVEPAPDPVELQPDSQPSSQPSSQPETQPESQTGRTAEVAGPVASPAYATAPAFGHTTSVPR